MPHDHPHGAGHNHAHADHLHSHMAPDAASAEIAALASQFIEGFTAATDKAAFLRLAGVPLEIPSESGGAALKLVDVRIASEWRVGAASPAFGGGLSYLPYPGDMIHERVNCAFVYVSLTERTDVDLRQFLQGQTR